jgi:hypothetical protein
LRLDRATLRWFLLAPLAAALVAHAMVYNFVDDDAYISFVFARNFAEHNQLVFNLGERVEGYTNFLWTLTIGLLMKLGVAPDVSARILGAAFAIGSMIVTVKIMERLRGAASLWDVVPAALLAAASGFACWSSGGLETQMFTFFCTLGIERAVARRYTWSGVAFALATMTRPEGLLVFEATWIAETIWTFRRREDWKSGVRETWRWVPAFLAVYLPYFAWRFWYYGYLFPNTAYVKAGGKSPTPNYAHDLLSMGGFYVWQWTKQVKALFAIPFVAVAAWHRPRFATIALLVIAEYLLYAWRVGGDFMGLHRFIMPVFVLLAVLVGLGLASLAERVPQIPASAAAGIAVAVVALFAASQVKLTRASIKPGSTHGVDTPGYLKEYAHDRILAGKALAGKIAPDELSWVGGAGVQPYFGRLRSYDVFGLVSTDVAHKVPPTRPRAGHQKWAPQEMVLATDPTFIFYCYSFHGDPSPARIQWNCGGEIPFFESHGYEPATLFIPGARKGFEYYTFLKKKDRAWP